LQDPIVEEDEDDEEEGGTFDLADLVQSMEEGCCVVLLVLRSCVAFPNAVCR
jgi:hypothetical protein